MAGVQYPYVKKIVGDAVDVVEADDHNKQEEQIGAITDARGGTWANDGGRPTPDPNNPYPVGYNVTRVGYEYYNGSAWIQLEILAEKGVANGYAPLDGSALVPLVNLPATPPAVHASSHEDSGTDEINLTGLAGESVTPQPPKAHAASHMGGSDPVTPVGIGADTPTERNTAISNHSAVTAAHHTRPVDGELLPAVHNPSHETGGADEIVVTGLLGILANAQIPQAHKDTHKTGGSDSFLAADLLQARVKRLQDAGGIDWELATLTADEILKTNAAGEIISAPPPAKKVVFALTRVGVYGEFAVNLVATDGQGHFSFYIPDEFVSLVSLKIIGIVQPAAAGAGKDIDLFSNYAQHGELYNAHAESEVANTYDLTGLGDRLWELDLSPVFSVLAAGDHCGLQIDHNLIGGSIGYLNIELVYA